MNTKKTLTLLIFFMLVLYSCNRKNELTPLKAKVINVSEVNMSKLLHPQQCNEKAPEKFQVIFKTTKGEFTLEVERELSPNGVDRFYNLVKNGYYNDTAFFRVIDGFVAQFGINGNPELNKIWSKQTIPDDPVKASNVRGTISFATAGPNTRTTQLFINYRDNSRLDSMGFAPFGRVIKGMDVVDKLYSGYGEGEPYGNGPSQQLIQMEGNKYLKENFPELDYIISTSIVEI